MDELDKKIKHIWNKIKKAEAVTSKKDCPEDSMFSSYIDGVLGETDKEKMESHLLECNGCLDLVLVHHKVKEGEVHETVAEVPAFLMNRAKGLVPEKEIGEGFFDIVLKFARETIEIITNPGNLGISYAAAPVPVRGEKGTLSSNLITLNKTFSDVESQVDVERTGRVQTNIRFYTKDIKSGIPVEGLRISLFDPDREIASYIARKGEVHFVGLECGEYIIKIIKKGKEIGQMSLKIKK